jgi:hypothetical protein
MRTKFQLERVAVLLAAVVVSTASSAGAGTVVSAGDPIDSGREELNDSGTYPWYDASNDDVRRLKQRKISEPPPRTSAAQRGSSGAIAIVWVILGIGMALLIAALIYAWLRREDAAAVGSDEEDRAVKSAADRIEQLPFPIRRPRGDLLDEARLQYEAGNFAEAIIYLFSFQLVLLDRHQWIRLTKGKTNREYLGELRTSRPLYDILERATIVFEDVYFGRYELERRRFETCWSQVDRFRQLAEGSAA